MAASRSTNTARGLRSHPDGTSFRSRASPTATGTASTMAIVDVTMVPKMKAKAPNDWRPEVGFQLRPVRNFTPNWRKASVAPDPRTQSISASSAMSPTAMATVVPRKTRSPRRERRRTGAPVGRERVSPSGVDVIRLPGLRAGGRGHGLPVDGHLRDLLERTLCDARGQRGVVQLGELGLPLRQRPVPEVDERLRLVLARLVLV